MPKIKDFAKNPGKTFKEIDNGLIKKKKKLIKKLPEKFVTEALKHLKNTDSQQIPTNDLDEESLKEHLLSQNTVFDYSILFQKDIAHPLVYFEHTDLNLSNKTYHLPSLNDSLPAILMSVQFNNKSFIEDLKTRTDTKIPFHELRTNKGDNPFCLSTQLEHNQEIFQYLLNHPNMDLTSPCSNERTPFQIVATHGSPNELKKYTKKICKKNESCIEELTCQQRQNDGNTALHDISQKNANMSETLHYLFDHGANNCWRTLNRLNQNPYMVALENQNEDIAGFYNENVLNDYDKFYYNLTPLNILTAVCAIFFFKFFYDFFTQKENNFYFNKLTSKLPKSLGPKKYLGYLKKSDLKININATQELQKTFQFNTNLPNLEEKADVETINDHTRNVNLAEKIAYSQNLNRLVFYIPGTASSLGNPHISKKICTHLSFVLDAPVYNVHHATPDRPMWPLQLEDTCKAIKHILDNKTNAVSDIILSGYSSGALLATLVAIILSGEITFSRLILFSPALDLSDEIILKPKISFIENILTWLFKYFKLENMLPNNTDNLLRFFQKQKIMSSKNHFNQILEKSHREKIFSRKLYFHMIYTGIGKKYAYPFIKLRHLSPAWYDESCFPAPDKFPKTDIITGENDYFRASAEIFFRKLKTYGFSINMLVIPGWDHSLMWKSLLGIYMSQELNSNELEASDHIQNIGEELKENDNQESENQIKETYKNASKTAKYLFSAYEKHLNNDERDEELTTLKSESQNLLSLLFRLEKKDIDQLEPDELTHPILYR
ncbi:MAG: alpha/beta hydrolase [Gammaproteobacteria bacterium]